MYAGRIGEVHPKAAARAKTTTVAGTTSVSTASSVKFLQQWRQQRYNRKRADPRTYSPLGFETETGSETGRKRVETGRFLVSPTPGDDNKAIVFRSPSEIRAAASGSLSH